MTRIVILDATPLGLIANPRPNATALACQNWATALEAAGHRIVVPEIADYEIRRELLRAGKRKGLFLLDRAIARFEYLPITTGAMKVAAQIWAFARQSGIQTDSSSSLDADVILAAQALSLNDPTAVIATKNVSHLSRFAPAEDWSQIAP